MSEEEVEEETQNSINFRFLKSKTGFFRLVQCAFSLGAIFSMKKSYVQDSPYVYGDVFIFCESATIAVVILVIMLLLCHLLRYTNSWSVMLDVSLTFLVYDALIFALYLAVAILMCFLIVGCNSVPGDVGRIATAVLSFLISGLFAWSTIRDYRIFRGTKTIDE